MKVEAPVGEASIRGKSVNPGTRKWLKLLHVVFSLSWFGGNLSLGVLNFFVPRPDSASALVLLNVIFYRVDIIIVAAASVLSLVTGLLLCWKTNWGFFRHGWVIVKLFVTLLVIVFCTIASGPAAQETIALSRTLGMGALHNDAYIADKMLSAIVQPAIFVLLLFLAYLSIFKPWKKRKGDSSPHSVSTGLNR